MNRFWDWKKIAIAAALVCLALYPVVHGSQYIMHVTIMFFIWGVVASLWNLLAGYAGVLSLGNMAFLLIGGYTSGILSKTFGVSPWFAVLIAALATMIAVTIILALPALRLTGIYIALLTIVFSDALPSLLTQTRKFTGGAAGLKEIPPFWPGMERIHAYYVVFAVFLIILALIYRITRSNTGLAFQAMRDDEDLALSLGVNLYLEKIKVFAVTSFFTGLIGGVYVHYLGSISPATNSLESFMLAICMIFLGGGSRVTRVLSSGRFFDIYQRISAADRNPAPAADRVHHLRADPLPAGWFHADCRLDRPPNQPPQARFRSSTGHDTDQPDLQNVWQRKKRLNGIHENTRGKSRHRHRSRSP